MKSQDFNLEGIFHNRIRDFRVRVKWGRGARLSDAAWCSRGNGSPGTRAGERRRGRRKTAADSTTSLGDADRQDSDDCVDVDEAASHDDEANLIRVLFTDLGASNVPTRNIAGVVSPPVIDRLSE